MNAGEAQTPSSARRQRSSRQRGGVTLLPFALLCLAVAGAPLPFGSTDAVSQALLCIILGAAVLLAAVRPLANAQAWALCAVAVIAALYGFVLHEQLSDHPWVAATMAVWSTASELTGIAMQPVASVARDTPWFALGAPLAALLALTSGLLVGTDPSRARQIIRVVAWSGAAYAGYSVLSFLLAPTLLLWREKRAYLGNLTGTFINRNTAAAYFGSCATLWLLLILARARGLMPRGPRLSKRAMRRMFVSALNKLPFSLISLLTCLIALFLTGSRAGITVSCLALSVAFFLFWRHHSPTANAIRIPLLASAGMVLLLLQIMGGLVSARFSAQGLADESRLDAYRSTLHMIADHPWFGVGLGTFAWAFPAYRTSDMSMWGVWDIAHSTPLELAAELGLPLAVVISMAWLGVLVVLIHGIKTCGRDFDVPLAGFSILLIALLHSSVDFSFQISGYAIIVCAVVGAALARSLAPPSHANRGRDRNKKEQREPHLEGTHAHESTFIAYSIPNQTYSSAFDIIDETTMDFRKGSFHIDPPRSCNALESSPRRQS